MEIKGVLFDEFLTKSINVAHFWARRAEESEEAGETASAIDYHGKAAMMMQEFLDATEQQDFQVNLSLKLQCNYHKKRVKFLMAIDAYKKNNEQTALHDDQNAKGADTKADGSTNFSLLKRQIQTGSLMELRGIASKLLDIVKIQQEQILYLSQQLQVINAENIALKKASLD